MAASLARAGEVVMVEREGFGVSRLGRKAVSGARVAALMVGVGLVTEAAERVVVATGR